MEAQIDREKQAQQMAMQRDMHAADLHQQATAADADRQHDAQMASVGNDA